MHYLQDRSLEQCTGIISKNMRHAEITVCYNNNEGTDAKWQPMLDRTFAVKISKSGDIQFIH